MAAFTRKTLIAKLHAEAAKLGEQRLLAKQLGISSQYLSDILNGRREPGEKVLAALGIKRADLYEAR